MLIPKEKNARLEHFCELFKRSESARDDAFEAIIKYRKQYEGSKELDGGVNAKVVRNITYELIESQVSVEIPVARVDPKVWSERNDRNAKAIERLCANVRNEQPFERLNDEDERNTYIDGGSVWYVEWDDSIRSHNECGGLRITCTSAEDLFPQPGIYVIDEMDWVILRFQSTKEELVAKYGVSPITAADAENDKTEESGDDDICTVYVCFYKDEDDHVCQYIWSGATCLADIEDYFARKRYVCSACGRRRELCESFEQCDCGGDFILENEDYEELTRDVRGGDGFTIPAQSPKWNEDGSPAMRKITRMRTDDTGAPVMTLVDGVAVPEVAEVEEQDMEPTRIPWYRPSHFPIVVRKNTARRRSVLGQSDCEFIRPQQQEINKIESRIHDKIQSSGCYPYKPEECKFSFDDTIGQYVLNIPAGHSRAEFGVMDMLPTLQQEQMQSDRYYEHAKKALGITDSYQGQADTTAKSGIAKQAQIAQAAGRLQSKRVMKNAAYADLDRIIFQYYLAYADEPRPLAYVDAFGRVQNSTFNRYDFIRYDEETREWYYEDRYLFSVDQNASADVQREVLWQMNLQNLQAGVYGNPAEVATLLRYWQMQEKAHYPHARENVEYFMALLNAKQQGMAQGAEEGAMNG
jgi:hypothetical protein